jgi:hypothetical protein
MAPEWVDDYPAFRDYIHENLGPKPTPRHSIDRIENHEGYEPGNLKWSTPPEQAQNSRSSWLNKDLNALILACLDEFRRKPRRSVREVC